MYIITVTHIANQYRLIMSATTDELYAKAMHDLANDKLTSHTISAYTIHVCKQ